MSSSSSFLTLTLGLVATGVYGYSIYFMNFDTNIKGMDKLQPRGLLRFGLYRFLTYQCLLIQFASGLLHVLAHLVAPLRGLRDLVFTALAYPVGSVVVYSFWGVWFLVGRELIFPVAMSQFYPDWLNHATHSIVVPVNFLLLASTSHKYKPSQLLVTLLYFVGYGGLLLWMHQQTGHWVYKYLESMNDTERYVYVALTGLLSLLMYQSGKFLSRLLHREASQRPPVARKQKQK